MWRTIAPVRFPYGRSGKIDSLGRGAKGSKTQVEVVALLLLPRQTFLVEAGLRFMGGRSCNPFSSRKQSSSTA